MTEVKSTPGPWAADEAEGYWGVFAEGDGDGIAMLWEPDGPIRPTEAEANARLIAATPEMFEALRNLAGQSCALRAFELEIREVVGNTNWQCLTDAIAQADAALAKARGES